MTRLKEIERLVEASDRMVRETESLTGIERSIRWAELSGELPSSPDPQQVPSVLYVPGLPVRPWYDPADFSWTRSLEDNYLEIKRELDDYLASQPTLEDYFDKLRPMAPPGTWKFISLAHYGRREPVVDRFPRTWELLQNVPRLTSHVGFSMLAPGASIRRHTGPLNTRLILHLGLEVPPGPSIRVGDETREWEEGRTLIFDDSFLHEVSHRGSEPRRILLVCFYHPDLTDEEVAVLERMRYIERAREQMLE